MAAVFPIILTAGAILVARNAWNTAGAVQRLEYSNPRVKLKSARITNIELTITLDIRNPATADIPLDYFTGNIFYGGAKLTSFTFDAKGTNVLIRGRQTTTVPFTVVISNLGAVLTAAKIIKALSLNQPVDTVLVVDGSIYAAGLDVPVKFSYDLKNNNVVLLK